MLTLNKIKYIGSIQKIFVILLCCVFYCFNSVKSNALFTREYQKNLSIGAYKQTYHSDIYLLAEAGYMAYSRLPNIGTAIYGYVDTCNGNGNDMCINNYITPKVLEVQFKGKNNYFVRIGFGFHTEKSNFRHELYFKWYSMFSKTRAFDGFVGFVWKDTKDYVNSQERGTWGYVYGREIANGGIYANLYKIMYGLNYDFQNVFKLLNIKWDVYLGVGLGIAIINFGIYSNIDVIWTTMVTSDGVEARIQMYKYNEVKDIEGAEKNSALKQKSIGIAYSASIGTICNLSQSFAFTMAVNFDATTRPLLTTKFKKIPSNQYSKTHLEYNISISMGLLMKAFEIRD